jgi:hypothetical protein
MKWKNGAIYEGFWIDDQIEGTGKYEWPEGMKYNGEFKSNRIDGRGVGTWPDGETYAGEWRNDKRDGLGRVSLPSGRVFVGSFVCDFPIHGQTTEPDGALYDTRFDGGTYISDWAPTTHVLAAHATADAPGHATDAPHWLRAVEWLDGRRFAGVCREGWAPLAGTLTEADGAEFLVTYDGSRGFADPLLAPATRTRCRCAGGAVRTAPPPAARRPPHPTPSALSRRSPQ